MTMNFGSPSAFFHPPQKQKKNTPTIRWRSASLSAAVEEGTEAVTGTRLRIVGAVGGFRRLSAFSKAGGLSQGKGK